MAYLTTDPKFAQVLPKCSVQILITFQIFKLAKVYFMKCNTIFVVNLSKFAPNKVSLYGVHNFMHHVATIFVMGLYTCKCLY